MSVCPEDVDFWSMLDDARTQIKERVDRPVKQDLRRRAMLSALPHVGRARRALPGGSIPHYTPAQEPMRGRLGLLLGCTERLTHSEIHRATIAVLSAEGYEVIAPQLPDCCGSIDLHGGDRARAKHHAEATIRAFEGVGGVDKVITSAGACGFALKDYGRLLGTAEARAFSAVALDVNELLTAAPLRSHLGPLGVTAVLHEACASCCSRSQAWSCSSSTPKRGHAAAPPGSIASPRPKPQRLSAPARRRRSPAPGPRSRADGRRSSSRRIMPVALSLRAICGNSSARRR
jgi:Fe-S oxidoreductase